MRTFESQLEEKRRGGGVSHAPWVDKSIMIDGVEREHEPFVGLNNSDDGYYIQMFRNRQEVEEFIKEMQDAADEAWPETAEHRADARGVSSQVRWRLRRASPGREHP